MGESLFAQELWGLALERSHNLEQSSCVKALLGLVHETRQAMDHMYYVKNRNFWTMEVPNGLTWSLRKIWRGRDDLVDAGSTHYVFNGKYSIRNMYKILKGDTEKVDWKRLVCNNTPSPKSLFILWLAIQNRLPTKDRLISWHLDIDGTCSLCNQATESVARLFLSSDFASTIWDTVI